MQLSNLFNEADIIHVYTRKQAIEDGVLVDVSAMAKEAGINYPVALTSSVWHNYIVPNKSIRPFGQSIEGRLWDLLWMFITSAKKCKGSYLNFSCSFLMKENIKENVIFKSICSPGDTPEPVITIMMPNED